MKKPNFFVIGAPKCGTTSLAFWLSQHPQIYMSPIKEPHHFNTDHNYVLTPSRKEYEALFRGANEKHKAVGEASVWYLYSEKAVLNIEVYTKSSARYIVNLRNPIEMAYSLYEEQVFSGKEHIEDFTTAWSLQERRYRGVASTPRCKEPRLLAYGEACKLGKQLERLFGVVPRDRVHVILLDDLRVNPRKEYLRVLRFLDLEDDGRMHFPVRNAAKGRSRLLRFSFHVAGKVKKSLGIKRSFGVMENAARLINRRNIRAPLPEEMRGVLRDYFRDDVLLLSDLLERDLSSWLK